MTAKITIVTVVLNQADALRQTMQSVFDQSYQNLDYIIIDGDSTDGTLDVIKAAESRLSAWESDPDNGIYDAMNKGWALADPESLVLFLGAGDRLISVPENFPPVGDRMVLFGNVSLENNQVFYARADFRLKLFNTLHHQALLIPKWLHPQPPFNLEYPHYADFDFNQRLYKKQVAFRFSSQLKSYAAPGGVTERLVLGELRRIVLENFGFFWAWLSMFGFKIAKHLPLIQKLRPIR